MRFTLTRRRAALAGVPIAILIVMLPLQFVQGQDEGSNPDLTIEVFAASDAVDDGAIANLMDTIEATAAEALGISVTVTAFSDSFAVRFDEERRRISDEIGLTALEAELFAPESAIVETQQEADELTAAQARWDELLLELEQRLGAAPVVELQEGHVGIELTSARRYPPSRALQERWATLGTGVQRLLHPSDAERQRQSIANQVMVGIGVLAGLQTRIGEPSEAMTESISSEDGGQQTRDAQAVTFTDDERERIVSAFVVEEGT